MPMQYTAIFHGCKNVNFLDEIFLIFFLFLLKTLIVGEAVLTSTHNLCFRAKIGEKCKPLYTPVLLYKSGV